MSRAEQTLTVEQAPLERTRRAVTLLPRVMLRRCVRLRRRAVRVGALLAAAAGLAAAGHVHAQAARDYISIVGSSTVYPFAIVAAERFGRRTGFPTPKIESTGTGGGLRLFCAGVGVQHPDIANASRRILPSELRLCERNGVDEVVEVMMGYDGIVIANANEGQVFDLSLREVYLALGARVPDPSGARRLVANPYRRWSDIDSSLPDVEIEVLGPPPTSGTRDAFVELAMEAGCGSFEWIADLDTGGTACQAMREDGAYIEAGENDNLIVQKLDANADALGIFGFSFLDQNMDKVKGSKINGVPPTFETIADGEYPISRPLYSYAKRAHVGAIPGIEEYLAELTSEDAAGEFGYFSELGLIPLPEEARERVDARVERLEPLTPAELAGS